MNNQLRKVVPGFVFDLYRDAKVGLFEMLLKRIEEKQIVRMLHDHGLNVSRTSDFYSPLPDVSALKKNVQRWFKPSELVGIKYDLTEMKSLLKRLIKQYGDDYRALPSYDVNTEKGYGPGFSPMDAMVLYLMIRDLKPSHYMEVGSGLSTYYCSLAARHNRTLGNPLKITCIDPYPYKTLFTVPEIEIIEKEVQDVETSFFEQLETGDVLFIDSSHIVKIDGDVSYLFLEIIPRVKPGVIIHIHDVPFPYNVPYPPKTWMFERDWPFFWNEAMLLQAFLCQNNAYSILLSAPLLRYYDEGFLKSNVLDYATFSQDPANTFSSIWIRKQL